MSIQEPVSRIRLSGPERRAALLEAGLRVFSEGSYRGTTTSEIARAAGVTEPVMYRHFSSKRDLYLACVDEAWRRVRELWEQVIAGQPDPGLWIVAMARAIRESQTHRFVISRIWLQALAEASEDAEVREHMAGHLRDVHAFITDVHERSQAAGGVLPDRNARAEAWVFLAIGLLRSVSDTVGPFADDDLPLVAAARHTWLTGRPPPPS